MNEPLEFIGIKIPKKKKEELEKYANKHHSGNISEAIREFINKGLAINSYKDEIDFLRQMIREELESTLDKDINSIRALISKGAIMSASSHFTLAEVLEKLVDPKHRRVLEEVLTENKKKGYVYITSKELGIEEELLKELKKLVEPKNIKLLEELLAKNKKIGVDDK